MKTLVTGGTGYIGSKLVRFLSNRGEDVRVLGLPGESLSSEQDSVQYVEGDILNAKTVQRAMSGCDRVYHLAAYARNWARDPMTFQRINVIGTEIVLEASLEAGIQRMVCVLSNLALGPSGSELVDENTRRTSPPFTAYERSKILAEDVARAYQRRGHDVVLVYPTRVFGPGVMTEGNSITRMIDLYLRGKWRVIPGSGVAFGNYVFIEDLIGGITAAMDRGRPGGRYILGGENISFMEFFELVARISGVRFRMVRLPAFLAMAFSYEELLRAFLLKRYPLITPGWTRTFLLDWRNSCARAQHDIAYRITPITEAIQQTMDWLRSPETAFIGKADDD